MPEITTVSASVARSRGQLGTRWRSSSAQSVAAAHSTASQEVSENFRSPNEEGRPSDACGIQDSGAVLQQPSRSREPNQYQDAQQEVSQIPESQEISPPL